MLFSHPTDAITSRLRVAASVGVVVILLAACSGAPVQEDRASAKADNAPSTANAGSPKSGSTEASGGAPSGAPGAAGGASGTASPPAQPVIPQRALSDFDRAVGLMR